MEPIKLYILDDHRIVIDGISALLEHQHEFKIVGTSTSCKEALHVLKTLAVDIVLTDINMPEMNGIEFVRALKRIRPEIKILALSMYGEKTTITDMVDAGAHGYVLKNTGRAELVKALTTVQENKKYYSPDVAAAMHRKDELVDKRYVLTSREREIVKYVAQGLSHTQIGEKLFISPRTVDTHRSNIMRKFEVNSIAELTKLAIQLKLIE
jgi:two-component system nitrate/nitrite response regulator NarL